jgi:hypothetical protein
MRHCLGIRTEVTQLQLENIEKEQREMQLPYLLKDVEATNENYHLHVPIQILCRYILIVANGINMVH